MIRISWAVATLCGIGHCPIAPGTVASIAAVAAWYLCPLTAPAQGAVVAGSLLLGRWAAQALAAHRREHDPGVVVVDEVVGQWIAVLGLPHTPLTALIALAGFRLFDISKIPPVRWCERLPGGLGIMADDVAAGLMARALTVAALRLIGG